MADVAQHFDLKARHTVSRALEHSKSRNKMVTPLELLLAIVETHDPSVEAVFLTAAVSMPDAMKKLQRAVQAEKCNDTLGEEAALPPATKKVIGEANSLAASRGSDRISVGDLFLATLLVPDVQFLLKQFGVDAESLANECWEVLDLSTADDNAEVRPLQEMRLQVQQAMQLLSQVGGRLLLLDLEQASRDRPL